MVGTFLKSGFDEEKGIINVEVSLTNFLIKSRSSDFYLEIVFDPPAEAPAARYQKQAY